MDLRDKLVCRPHFSFFFSLTNDPGPATLFAPPLCDRQLELPMSLVDLCKVGSGSCFLLPRSDYSTVFPPCSFNWVLRLSLFI